MNSLTFACSKGSSARLAIAHFAALEPIAKNKILVHLLRYAVAAWRVWRHPGKSAYGWAFVMDSEINQSAMKQYLPLLREIVRQEWFKIGVEFEDVKLESI